MGLVPRILFQHGDFVLYTYTLFAALGVVAGVLAAWGAGRLAGRPFDELSNGTLWTIVGAAIGARLWDTGISLVVGGRWWPGALVRGVNAPSVYGVLLGGLAGLLLWSRRHRWNSWTVLDTAAVGLAVGSAFLWGSLMVHGGAYGVPLSAPWARPLPDLAGIVVPRAPVQVGGLVLNLLLSVLFAGVVWVRGAHALNGWLVLAWAGANGAFLLVAGFWRADPTVWVGPLRLDQVGALAQVALVAGIVAWRLWRGAHIRLREGRARAESGE